MLARSMLVAVAALAIACSQPKQADLDRELITVVSNAHLRTDRVGDGDSASRATFVLVDAENRSDQAANVTLGGELLDHAGKVIATLNPESLWMGPGDRRTFALVDHERKERPDAAGGRVTVRGAKVVTKPLLMQIKDVHSFPDDGRVVIQGTLHNGDRRAGTAMVIAAFYDSQDLPMTRPFSMIPIGGNIDRNLQFVGPPGSTRAALYLGELVY